MSTRPPSRRAKRIALQTHAPATTVSSKHNRPTKHADDTDDEQWRYEDITPAQQRMRKYIAAAITCAVIAPVSIFSVRTVANAMPGATTQLTECNRDEAKLERYITRLNGLVETGDNLVETITYHNDNEGDPLFHYLDNPRDSAQLDTLQHTLERAHAFDVPEIHCDTDTTRQAREKISDVGIISTALDNAIVPVLGNAALITNTATCRDNNEDRKAVIDAKVELITKNIDAITATLEPTKSQLDDAVAANRTQVENIDAAEPITNDTVNEINAALTQLQDTADQIRRQVDEKKNAFVRCEHPDTASERYAANTHTIVQLAEVQTTASDAVAQANELQQRTLTMRDNEQRMLAQRQAAREAELARIAAEEAAAQQAQAQREANNRADVARMSVTELTALLQRSDDLPEGVGKAYVEDILTRKLKEHSSATSTTHPQSMSQSHTSATTPATQRSHTASP